jgi:hypothetical protein
MSIEKLSDVSQVLVEQYPFTQIPNNVILSIKDNDAFRLYVYLLSKSRDWRVVKEYAAKECGIGEKKARECWSYFARCGLIEYRTEKDGKGKIIKHDMVVLIGLKFNKDEPFKPVDKSTGAKTASVAKTHIGKNPLSGQSTRVDFAPLLNKEITNKEKATKQRESTARKKRVPLSEFSPNKNHVLLAKAFEVDLNKEVDSFKNRHSGKGNLEYEFEQWLNKAKEYKHSQLKKIAFKTIEKEEIIRPRLRDFTQERLDRERLQEINRHKS